ncbi:hypothetical protein [Mesorhizobium sp. M0643]|uniref:hypothetical protein n=1 Tax=Mesorhizobium sp. M0643 TaxID=2956978 RepID=UPI003337393D
MQSIDSSGYYFYDFRGEVEALPSPEMRTKLEEAGLLTLSKIAGKPVTRVDVLIKWSQKDGKYELCIASLIGATRGWLSRVFPSRKVPGFVSSHLQTRH